MSVKSGCISTQVRSRPVEVWGRELKFVFLNVRSAAALALLRSRCRLDPMYATGIVSSIYYDDRDFRSLREKINSDYLKTKVRLRWYGGASESVSFIEAKYRVGDRRDKVRIQTPYSAVQLAGMLLHDPLLEQVPRLLRSDGVLVSSTLRPLFLIRYERHRFVEPLTGSRVSLDFNISVPVVNQQVPIFSGPVTLSAAVVEVKGSGTDLPAVLAGLLYLGCRRSSFSKYYAGYQNLVRARV